MAAENAEMFLCSLRLFTDREYLGPLSRVRKADPEMNGALRHLHNDDRQIILRLQAAGRLFDLPGKMREHRLC